MDSPAAQVDGGATALAVTRAASNDGELTGQPEVPSPLPVAARHALRQAIMSCRSGGVVSVIGVHGGMIDKFPAGAWMNRSPTLRTGQCHVQKYTRPLLGMIGQGKIDPTRIITHRLPLTEGPTGHDLFKNKKDHCEKVVLTP
ncbi:hypothetical protein ACFXGG_31230 [Streptomyces nigra]|uniref:hypothetical protein n=1 Tax=Streptomyces nigra TaxID=1827580 RepID=UPI0036BB67D8